MRPAPSPDVGTAASGIEREVLFTDARTSVWRTSGPDGAGPVVCKEAFGPSAGARIRHEADILRRLAGVPGVPEVVPTGDPRLLVTRDVGGRALDRLLAERRLGLTETLELAVRLATVLDGVHAAGVIHRDLHPGNVVLSPDGAPTLVDFDLATSFTDVRPPFTHHAEILGRLSYLAPEQTGRTGLPVDLRADLYAFGVLLYELVAGEPPFVADDPLELLRGVLARTPDEITRAVPQAPAGLAAVVARLLRKQPDRRYQSAAGLRHDLARLRTDPQRSFTLGERDFAARLTAPTTLVGRAAETAALVEALDGAIQGCGGPGRTTRAVLLSGGPGVGKSALTDALRPVVTARGGWFVAGKNDQFQRGSGDGLLTPLRALARFLLAEDPAALERGSRDLLERMGSNASLLTALVPDFEQVLGPQPTPTALDPAEVQHRTRQAVVQLLRGLASPARPLVLFLDDLQWAPPGVLDVVDAVLDDDELCGLLLVCAFRDGEVDPTHPLSGRIERWARLGTSPVTLHLENLEPSDLATLLGQVLRLPADRAADLALVVGERTRGNPYETMELLNGLRGDGVLVLGDSGWVWDPDTVRHHIGSGDVVELLRERIERLPDEAADLMTLLACLGAEVDLEFLAAASGHDAARLRDVLSAPLAAGLLVPVHSGATVGGDDAGLVTEVRFRHDRVQQAAHDRVTDELRRELRLTIARRLSATGEFIAQAAAQFLAAGAGTDGPSDPDEQRRLLPLYQEAADRERRSNNHAAAERCLDAASRIARALLPPDDARLVRVESEHHSALIRLGRLAEADARYESVRSRCSAPLVLADVVCAQIESLGNRSRYGEALAIGMELLAGLGVRFPADGAEAEVARRVADLARWIADLSLADDVARAPMSDPAALAASRVMYRMSAPAYFSDPLVSAWLVTEARRLWEEAGPGGELLPTLAHGGVALVALLDDYRSGHRLMTHLLAVGEAKGYETAVARTRFLYSITAVHWQEPLENAVTEARVAREALLHVGDTQQAVYAYYGTIFNSLELAPSLDDAVRAADAALLASARVGNLLTQHSFGVVRQFCRAAQGLTAGVTCFSDAAVDERDFEPLAAAVPLAAAYWHHARGLAAALAGDDALLAAHSEQAHRAGQALPGIVVGLVCSVVHAVRLGQELQRTPEDDPAGRELEAELDGIVSWLRARAADQPENVQHLLHLAEAEQAWALGDVDAAARSFDAGLLAVQRVCRPWHHALLARRAGVFHLQQGLEHTGRLHLGLARRVLADWGAAGLVAALDRSYPFLRSGPSLSSPGAFLSGPDSTSGSRGLTSDAIDMAAILRAAQALASRTNLAELRETIVDQLRVISGATDVHLLLLQASGTDWLVHHGTRDSARTVPLDDPEAARLVPVSAARYVLRTRRPLVVDDARLDDRFARDPFLADVDRCALLVVPVVHSGDLRAVLLLENRLAAGTFTIDRLDAVTMLTGQLAVALDNSQLYASLEERIAARTAELQSANAQLARLTKTDSLTGVANRRHFDERLLTCWGDSARTGAPVAVIMIDVDHFKRYNDVFGHQAGDACLVTVSAALSGCIREADLLCRYGGEEFAVVLPGAGLAAAAAVAERARAAVAAAAVPHVPDVGIVSVSIGVASTIARPGEPPATLVASADAALYEAKRAGRNCVVVDSGQPADQGSR